MYLVLFEISNECFSSLATALRSTALTRKILFGTWQTGIAAGLHYHDIPAAIYVETVPFTPENGLLTVSFKPIRRTYRLNTK